MGMDILVLAVARFISIQYLMADITIIIIPIILLTILLITHSIAAYQHRRVILQGIVIIRSNNAVIIDSFFGKLPYKLPKKQELACFFSLLNLDNMSKIFKKGTLDAGQVF